MLGRWVLVVLLFVAACDSPAGEVPAPSAETPRPVFVEASRNDCASCPRRPGISGLAAVEVRDSVEVWVRLTSPPAVGDGLWVWFQDAPPQPVALERTTDGWAATVPHATPVALDDLGVREDGADLVITIDGTESESARAVAVVSNNGDRLPSTGYVHAVGEDTRITSDDGALAQKIADQMASVQSAFPGLSADERAFAQATMARHLVPGTFRYDMAFVDRPELRLVAEVSVRYPQIAQHLYADIHGELTLAQSVLVLADGTTVCTWMTDGSADCEGSELALPVTNLAGLVADPTSITIEPAPPRRVADGVAACWRVLETTTNGPPPGESCSLSDGVLTVNDNSRSRHRLVMTARTGSVDDAAFVLP